MAAPAGQPVTGRQVTTTGICATPASRFVTETQVATQAGKFVTEYPSQQVCDRKWDYNINAQFVTGQKV